MRYGYIVVLALFMGISLHAEDEVMESEKTLAQVAKQATRPLGSPDHADVCFRYGWVRKESFPTVEDAKKAMRAFHATRVDWFYPGTHTAQDGAKHVTPEAKAFIDWCHDNSMKIGGAINNNTKNPEWKYKKHHLDRYIGDPSRPEFIADVLTWGKAQIDAGVDTMVCDDIFKYDAPRQKLWSDKVLAVLKAHKPGFTIAGNSGHNIGTGYIEKYAVDFHYSDNNFVPDPSDLWAAAEAHRKVKSAILMHPNVNMSKDVRRKLIALGYANGVHVITPWDEYIHGKDRMFADPADFADIYGFARALGQQGYLNGYEDAAVGGYDLKEARYGGTPPIAVSGGSGKLSVFGRAKPGGAHAPVVLHLVEWAMPTPSRLKLRPTALFAGGNLSAELHTPTTYIEEAHQKAEKTKDYSTLMEVTPLQAARDGEWVVVQVPALHPWSVLVVTQGGK